ncbi:hypothetical protein [Pectobacterium sp. B1J-3]|uniref:phage tail fiber protein n=1 Tax=Pectobacterium sp. B1J-3 TaxID=3385371 RepID=UPI003906B2DF
MIVRANLGLGDAATHDAQSSYTDATPGRILKVGAFGLGGACIFLNSVNHEEYFNASTPSGFYTSSGNPTITKLPTGFIDTFIEWRKTHIYASGVYGRLSVTAFLSGAVGHRTISREWSSVTGWSDWFEEWNSKSLPNPMTLDTEQTITRAKTFLPNVSDPIRLRMYGVSSLSMIRGLDFEGNPLWFMGKAESANKNIRIHSNLGDNFISLLENGNILIRPNKVGSKTVIDGSSEFSQKVKCLRNYAAFLLETNLVADGVMGRIAAIEYEGATSIAFLRRSSQEVSAGQQRVVLPMSGNGTILVSGINATVDASGYYKSASPVINIYADGSFTTTDEAEGVSVERLSEGVYKITGCQGMHPDAAWNGIDGGIANPKCRNDKALLWNNYEVDEDGSITVHTFHRVHPDAMPFAQNRLTLDKEPFDPKKGHKLEDTWPDQSPIDVPHGLFIQVRVNMPESEEPKLAIISSNVYCNTVSPTA